jgi:hypothetical protein
VLFYLGSHRPSWLRDSTVPLFVSHRTLRGRKTLPRASCNWALDSGGFSELTQHDRWQTTPQEYVEAVSRYAAEIGRMDWAAPMDWMCEPHMLEKTGLSVREHQERTVSNFLELRALAPGLPFIPVLQGWEIEDYLRCVELYLDAGVDLSRVPVVGIGSVCRRQHSQEIEDIVREVQGCGLRLHGFGVKIKGLARFGHLLQSADSMAWSFQARRRPPLLGCVGHKNCANCRRYALKWRNALLDGLGPEESQERRMVA